MIRWLLTVLLIGFWLFPAQAAAIKTANKLISAQSVAVSGSSIELAIHQKLPSGWHTYYLDPGDVGQPLKMQWLAPAGWQIGELQWPPAQTIVTPPNLTSHIYKNELLLPFTVRIPRDAAMGATTLKTKIDYLVCADICLPETAELTLPLQIGVQAVASPDAALIQQAAQADNLHPLQKWLMLGTALLAGLLMNLMPCVLPLLIIKAANFLQSPHVMRKALLTYLVGLFSSLYLMLGIICLARIILKENFGFEFLWQSKVFILSLIGIILMSIYWAISDTHFQLFKSPGIIRYPYLNHFITGALGMSLALPCTGPLLGPILFSAFSQNTFQNFLVFTCLGLGYALPIILILLIPGTRNWLPKPGPWLRYMRYVTAGLLLALALWLCGLLLTSKPTKMAATVTTADIFAAIASHENVFIDVTADWCLTCKFNEWRVINTPATHALFRANTVKTLQLDWTNRNADITAFLASHQRIGVPLYVWYHHGQPTILPQLLTPADLQNQLSRQ